MSRENTTLVSEGIDALWTNLAYEEGWSQAQMEELRADARKLEQDRSKLRELIPYAQHKPECAMRPLILTDEEIAEHKYCDCGLRDLLNTIKA